MLPSDKRSRAYCDVAKQNLCGKVLLAGEGAAVTSDRTTTPLLLECAPLSSDKKD